MTANRETQTSRGHRRDGSTLSVAAALALFNTADAAREAASRMHESLPRNTLERMEWSFIHQACRFEVTRTYRLWQRATRAADEHQPMGERH